MFLTFWGKPRWAQSEHIRHALHDAHGHGHHGDEVEATSSHSDTAEPREHDPGAADLAVGTGGYHPHESPWTMLAPLGVLALGAVAAGFVFHGWFIGPEAGERFWHGAVAFNQSLFEAREAVPVPVQLAATIVMLIGLATAWIFYIAAPRTPERLTDTWRVLYRFLLNKWYFDELYDVLFVKPAFAIGRLFWRGGDEGTIDRFGPNGSAWVVRVGSRLAVRLQTGYLYTYAFVMLIGLTAAVSWAISAWRS